MDAIPKSWRMLPGTNQEYAATPDGEIVRLPRRVELVRQGKKITRQYQEKVLTQSTTEFGHKTVGLTLDGQSCVQRVHRLVCIAYHGPPPRIGKDHVLHGDGNPANNRPENLRWGSPAENMDDKHRHSVERNIRCSEGHPIASDRHGIPLQPCGWCRGIDMEKSKGRPLTETERAIYSTDFLKALDTALAAT